MINFYGGQAGKDFRLSKVFENRVEAEADISRGIVSPIGSGEFVLISYGDPSITYPVFTSQPDIKNLDTEYYFIQTETTVEKNEQIITEYQVEQFNKNQETTSRKWSLSSSLEESYISIYLLNFKVDGEKSYNGCFYIKDYETTDNYDVDNDIRLSAGWIYRFISRITGPIPRFKEDVEVTLSTDDISKPIVKINSQNPDIPEMSIELPIPTATIAAKDEQVGFDVYFNTTNDGVVDGLDFNFTYPAPKIASVKVEGPKTSPQVYLTQPDTFSFEFTLPRGVELHQYSGEAPKEVVYGDLYINDQGVLFQGNENGQLIEIYNFVPQMKGLTYLPYNQNPQVIVTQGEGKHFIEFQVPKAPAFDATVKMVDSQEEVSVQKVEGPEGYTFNFSLLKGSKGDSMAIWTGHEPLELVSNLIKLEDIENYVKNYLNEKFKDTHPELATELFPITYIYGTEVGEDLAWQEVEDQEIFENIAEADYTEETDTTSGNISEIEEIAVNTLIITETTILGFFGYYAKDKWNIFLAPNSGGSGRVKWQIV